MQKIDDLKELAGWLNEATETNLAGIAAQSIDDFWARMGQKPADVFRHRTGARSRLFNNLMVMRVAAHAEKWKILILMRHALSQEHHTIWSRTAKAILGGLRHCERCGKWYVPARQKQRWCERRCRVQNYLSRPDIKAIRREKAKARYAELESVSAARRLLKRRSR